MEKEWSKIAQNFDELQRYVVGEEIDKIIKDELSKLKNLGNVLEFGCGNGNYTKAISSASENILATDISSEMIEVASKKLENYKNIKTQVLDCYKTEFEDKSYDTIFMANLIHVVQDPKKVIDESYRLLKDNGKLIIISFTPDGMTVKNKMKMIAKYLKVFGKPPKGRTSFTLENLTEFVANNNFEIKTAELLGKEQSKAIFIIAHKK